MARAIRRLASIVRTRQAVAVVVALAFVFGAVADHSGVGAAPAAGPLANLEVTDLAIGGASVYAATSDGVFKNKADADGSSAWTPLSAGLPAGPVAAIAFEPTSQRVFAAAPSGLYVLNAGASIWNSTAIAVPPSGYFTTIAMYGPRLAYLGTTTGAVLKVDVNTATSVVITSAGRSTKVSALSRVGEVLLVGDQNSVWECNVSADTCTVPTSPQLALSGPANRLVTIQGTVFVATGAGIGYRQATWQAMPIANPPGSPVTAMYASGNVVTVAVSANGRSTLKQSTWDSSTGTFSAWVTFGGTDSLPETRSLASAGQSSIWAGTASGPFLHSGTTVTEVSNVGVVATLTTTVTPTTGPTSTPAPTSTPGATETKTPSPTPTVTPSKTPSPTATSAIPTRVPAAAAPIIKTRVPTGGGVAIASDGLASVAIPSGALTGEVEVSMVPLVRPDPAGVIRYRSQLFYAQAVVDLADTRPITEAPFGQHPEEATYLAVAGSPYDVRLVDVATGRELRAVPPSVDLGIVYRLEDLPRGTTEFGLFLGRWDELTRTWVALPTRQDPDHRLLHAPLTSPSIVSVLIQAPVVVPTSDGNRYVGLTSQFVSPPMIDAVAGAGGLTRTGLPIAAQDATGAQLFQNARLEVDPATGVARFGNLGTDYVAAAGLTFAETPNAGMIEGMRYFPDTSRYVSDAIAAYYDATNGAVSLGLPISPESAEGGVFAQYFERGKVTIDPASLVVSVAPLGEDVLKLQTPVKPVAAEGDAAP